MLRELGFEKRSGIGAIVSKGAVAVGKQVGKLKKTKIGGKALKKVDLRKKKHLRALGGGTVGAAGVGATGVIGGTGHAMGRKKERMLHEK
jgi:hypothetical protein